MSLETIVHGRIGSLNWGAVYSVQAPALTPWPVIVWQRISSSPVETHEAPADLYRVRVQVDCYAEGLTDARSLMAEVVAAMEANQDESAISCADKSEGYEQDAEVYRATADFYVWANN